MDSMILFGEWHILQGSRSNANHRRALVKENPIPAFFYALGGFTFLKFVVKTLFVFSETFILQGTSVSVAIGVSAAIAHYLNCQLKRFGAGKGSWAGKRAT